MISGPHRLDAGAMVHLVDLLVAVARADGHIDPTEVEAVARLVQSTLGVPLDEALLLNMVRDAALRVKGEGAVAVVNRAALHLADAGGLEVGIRLGIQVALASKGIDPAERLCLQAAADAGGMTAASFEALLAQRP